MELRLEIQDALNLIIKQPTEDESSLINEKRRNIATHMWRFREKIHHGCEVVQEPDSEIVTEWIEAMNDNNPIIVFHREIDGHLFKLVCYSDGDKIHVTLDRYLNNFLWYYNHSLLYHTVFFSKS